FGRKFLAQAMSQTEVHAATIFERLEASSQLSLLAAPRLALVRTIARLLVRTGLPWHVLRAIVSPETAHTRLLDFIEELRISGKLQADKYAGASVRLAAVEQLILKAIPQLLSKASPVMLGGMATYALSGKLLGKLATEDELQVVLRGAPFNPTTEMNLALWTLAREVVQANSATANLIHQTPAAQLAENYQKANLPHFLQKGLTNFLAQYGHRSVAELDLGQPRWSEDPAYLLERLAHYLEQVDNPVLSPEVQFRRAAEEAEEMISELTGRAKHKSWLRGLLAHIFLRRAHILGGMREMPRFCLSLLLAQARELLRPVGEELTRAGRLEKAEDIFYITLAEAQMALAGTDLREVVNSRRDVFERELFRRNVPVVLLSDGTVPTFTPDTDPKLEGTLQGTPASPGLVTGIARVIFDPEGARINQGEILIAPSTDPGWTPLFMSAGGLVMEMGGAMSHGAIVAREYGIPAVVAVGGATLHIRTGQQITVDGSRGTIVLS
ncbi:MAG TPA: PEP-utilizing enzyme, partial [Chloroflexia bacterium]|nr:PEP-utilizing enzyme [Chloroflexia bacterium]